MKKILLAIFILITFLLIGAYFWIVSSNNYKTNGSFEIQGNEKTIKIKRDVNGIAYIFAENKSDLILGQGFVLAQDRLFQIEFYRAFIKGELSSIIGESMLTSDIKMKVIDIPNNAKKTYPFLNKESKDFLQWYCNGYNEYLKIGKEEFPVEVGLLNLNPQPLNPEELVAILHFIGYNQAQNYEDEILSLNLAASLKEAKDLLPLNINPDRSNQEMKVMDSLATELGSQLFPQPSQTEAPLLPAPQLGSNNWVISGKKSKSGKPIVANDPHLDARLLPGIWYPIGLFCPEFKAIGVALPGVPGILVGRNESVAFGVTNAYGDSQDLFIENTKDGKYLEQGNYLPFKTRKETIKVKDGKDIEIEVRSTKRGPIISDFKEFGILTDDVLSFRWSSAVSQSPSIGIEQFLEAKNTTDLSLAIEGIDLLFLNFVFADIEGNIAHQSTGLIPQRKNLAGAIPQMVKDEDSWIGFIPKNELPNTKNPERAWVGTANHDTRPDDYPYYYSSHFSPTYRYLRMQEMLSSKEKFDFQDMWDFILDCKNKQAEKLSPIFIKALERDEEGKKLAALLKEWNHEDKVDQVGAAVYHVLFDELVNLILNDELPDELENSYWKNAYYWSQNMHQFILEEHPFIDDVTTPKKESLSELIVKAGAKAKNRLTDLFGSDTKAWTWGKLHTVQFASPIKQEGFGASFLGGETFGKNGSNETINRGGYTKSDTTQFETEWFSSFRMVADLSDSEKIRGAISGGSAARILHPNYTSQLEVWKKETWIPYWFSEEKVLEHSKEELILN